MMPSPGISVTWVLLWLPMTMQVMDGVPKVTWVHFLQKPMALIAQSTTYTASSPK